MQKLQSQGVHHITIVGADRQTSIDLWEGVLGIVDRHVIPTAVSGRAIGGTGGKVSLGGYCGVLIAGPVSRCQPEDMYAGTLRGAPRALNAGVRTVADWSHIGTTPGYAGADIGGEGDGFAAGG